MVDDELELDLKPAGSSKLQRDACPDDLLFADQPFGLAVHPSRDLVAVGLVSGVVSVFSYALQRNVCVLDGLANPVHQVFCAFGIAGRPSPTSPASPLGSGCSAVRGL